MKATTLKELAALLSLSPSTVSKSLSDSGEISKATKNRVKEMAEIYGYVPNQMAKNLKLGKTRSIGVVLPNLKDEFFGMVFHGIEKAARKRNYNVIAHISDDKTKKEKECLRKFHKGTVDGVLISLAKETQVKQKTKHLDDLVKWGVPMVQFDRVFEHLDCDKVIVDDFDGAYLATKYLLDTGCEQIAFLSPIAQTSVGELRKEGYVQALLLEGNLASKKLVVEVNNYEEFKEALTRAYNDERIDGILAADELSAICALNTIQSMGIKVPEEVSIIGFTNGILAKCCIPSLTTVSQHATKLGEIAIKTLIKRIERSIGGTTEHRVLKTKLNIRSSTKNLVI